MEIIVIVIMVSNKVLYDVIVIVIMVNYRVIYGSYSNNSEL